MAAISCYQPTRSHLAQPARCLDSDEEPSATPFSFRRHQFVQRCGEVRPQRIRDWVPPEVSVRSAREVSAPRRHAVAQTAPTPSAQPPPLLSRLRRANVDSSWSKVEEVRKKFEGATAVASFSRSFESPPRRRLADSLFASFKLPRKKDSNGSMAAPRSLAPQAQHKRKSAVELLAETKAFYVKSETVRDRKQDIPLRVSSGLTQAIAQGGCHLVSSGTLHTDACCNPYATTRGRLSHSAGEGLQNTLRRLLGHNDSRENVYSPCGLQHKMHTEPRRPKDPYVDREMSRSQHNSGTFSGTSSSGTSGSKAHKSEPEKLNRPLSFGDARVFFPESFVIPRQRANEAVVKSAYSMPSSYSSPSNTEAGENLLGGELDTISPPAQYAHSAPRYIRSNSHSQPSAREDDGNTNINNHKSLPDLPTQVRCYTEHSTGAVCTEIIGRSPRRRRHSTHQRTASCSSKGTRSNHSSLISSCEAFSEHPSPGEDNYNQSYNSTSRCGSSFARDSGGSSGNYTQPTQAQNELSDHRGYVYGINGMWTECVVLAPPQFQDGATSPPMAPLPPVPLAASTAPPVPALPLSHTIATPRVGIHFQASAPPPQFQDEPPTSCEYDRYRHSTKPRHYARYQDQEVINKQPIYAEPRQRPRLDDSNTEYVNTTQICPTEEVTSPLGTFKRQRCLRYKQKKPILRSKSDISDRYRRPEGRSPASAPCEGSDSPDSISSDSARLHEFFTQLGFDSRQYALVLRSSTSDSPVFFSSASTVDSNHLPHTDYTVQGPTSAPKQIYRNSEPPSIVERNARIIKWLCQCRKAQQQLQNQ